MKLVIVGGVAGGASAAARARRLDENAEILLLQSGPDVSFASCGMPYFIGEEIQDRNKMAVQTPQSLNARLNITVRVSTRVTSIDTAKKTLQVTNEATGDAYEETYDQLILAVGAAPLKPPIPGINRPGLFALRNLQDMDQIVEWIEKYKPEHAVVAGAGFVGLEMVEQLHKRGMQVTLVELQKQILAPLDEEMAIFLHRDLEEHGVNVMVGDGIKQFDEDPTNPDTTSILTLQSGKILPPAQLTILGLGVRPDTKVIMDAGIECSPRGHVIVDDSLKTSAPDVWAVGDAVQIRNPVLDGEYWAVPLAGPANRQGRMVADNILGNTKRTYKGTYGVSIVRSFELYAGGTGMNEKFLRSKNIPYGTVHVHPNSHAGYYPGASSIHLKVIFDETTGKIYGAQAVGKDGVDKRIDVIATAMQGNLTVTDLADLELCYAPPVGSAKDPVNYAGMVAQNVVEGLLREVEWNELEKLAEDPNTCILDVRNPNEVERGPLSKHAVNIPLNDLRSRLSEVPRDKHIVVSCQSGQRAYYASRILRQSGYNNVDSLDGAYFTFHAIHPDTVE